MASAQITTLSTTSSMTPDANGFRLLPLDFVR